MSQFRVSGTMDTAFGPTARASLGILTDTDNTSRRTVFWWLVLWDRSTCFLSCLWGNGSNTGWDQVYITNSFERAFYQPHGRRFRLVRRLMGFGRLLRERLALFRRRLWAYGNASVPAWTEANHEIDTLYPWAWVVFAPTWACAVAPTASTGAVSSRTVSSSLNGMVTSLRPRNMLGLTFSCQLWDNNTAIDPVDKLLHLASPRCQRFWHWL